MPIEIITAGEFPGDGKPKAVTFPDLANAFVEIGGIKTVPLATLVEPKLASGMSSAGRRRDLADVQDLIRVLHLASDFVEKLDGSVRPMYLELWHELEEAREMTDAPDADA